MHEPHIDSDGRLEEMMARYDRIRFSPRKRIQMGKVRFSQFLNVYYSSVDAQQICFPEEIGRKIHLSRGVIEDTLSKLDLPYEKQHDYPKRRRKSHPARDALISKGLSLQEICDALERRGESITREGLRAYMTEEQHALWKEKRKEKETQRKKQKADKTNVLEEDRSELNKARSVFLSFLEQRVMQETESVDAIVARAVMKYRLREQTIEKYRLACAAYCALVSEGKRPTVTKIHDLTDIELSCIIRYLQRMELPLQTEKYAALPSDFIANLKQVAQQSPLCATDVAYFAGVHINTVRKWCGKKERQDALFGHKKRTLSYSLASKIYEAQDMEFTASEIAEEYETPLQTVAYALAHRTDIAPVIIDALRTLFPKEGINQPHK